MPLEDPDNVDKRRQQVGLGPIKDYVSEWGIIWDVEEYKKFLKSLKKKNNTCANTDNMGKLSSLPSYQSCHGFCFCSCTQDKFVMVIAPGHPTSLRYVGQSAHLHAI